MLGIGFAAGAKRGTLPMIGLAVELASLGIALVMSFLASDVSRHRALAIVAGLALAFVASAAGGSALIELLFDRVSAIVPARPRRRCCSWLAEEAFTEAHEDRGDAAVDRVVLRRFLVPFLIEMA